MRMSLISVSKKTSDSKLSQRLCILGTSVGMKVESLGHACSGKRCVTSQDSVAACLWMLNVSEVRIVRILYFVTIMENASMLLILWHVQTIMTAQEDSCADSGKPKIISGTVLTWYLRTLKLKSGLTIIERKVILLFEPSLVPETGMEKLCKSGWVNPETGRCSKGIMSLNKGKFCNSDLDCPTTDSSKYAKCKCAVSAEGKSFCDIEGGDDEWLQVMTSYENYIDFTGHCHNAAGDDSCQFEEYFKDWKCKQLKAELYVHFLDFPDCFDNLMKNHPIFAEYWHYCKGHIYYYALITAVLTWMMIMWKN